MIRTSLLALPAAAVALVLAPGAPGAVKAMLRVVDDTPLTVRGSGFRARENVELTVLMGSRSWSRAARPSASGSFTVQFKGVRLNRCALPLVISARRPGGATVRAHLALTDCMQP